MTSPCSGSYVLLPDVPSLPQRGPKGVWECMSVPMLLWGKMVWVSFHQFCLVSARAMRVAGSLTWWHGDS